MTRVTMCSYRVYWCLLYKAILMCITVLTIHQGWIHYWILYWSYFQSIESQLIVSRSSRSFRLRFAKIQMSFHCVCSTCVMKRFCRHSQHRSQYAFAPAAICCKRSSSQRRWLPLSRLVPGGISWKRRQERLFRIIDMIKLLLLLLQYYGGE